MDRYAENVKRINELHMNLVNDIREPLKEKGYKTGKCVHGNHTFDIYQDKLIINGFHTDWIDVENLLRHLNAATHITPKM